MEAMQCSGAKLVAGGRSSGSEVALISLKLSHDDEKCAQVYFDRTTVGNILIAWVGRHRPPARK